MEDSENLMRKAVKLQMTSTYRSDFTGTQLGIHTEAIRMIKYVPEWKSQAKCNNDIESRFHYQMKKQNQILLNNTTRYGCNHNHNKYAIGGSPNYNPFLRSVNNTSSLSDVFC
jgi:hypothetical protein